MPKIEAPAGGDAAAAGAEGGREEARGESGHPEAETTPVQQNTPAPQTTAAPRSEQQHRGDAAAPSPGSAASRAAIASWRDLVLARLQQNKRYPASAEARREQGVVTLSFSVDRNGRVLARSIARSSGVCRARRGGAGDGRSAPSRCRRFRRR